MRELSGKLQGLRAPLDVHQLADIELDAWVNIGAPEDGEEVSSWLIHTSWVAECDAAKRLSAFLEADLAARVSSGAAGTEGKELSEWLPEQAPYLAAAASAALSARDVCDLAAHVMAINVLLAEMLFVITRARLNSNMS